MSPVCKKIGNVTVEVIVGVLVNEENKGLEAEQFSALEVREDVKDKEEEGQTVEEEKKEVKQEKKKDVKTEEKVLKCTTCGESALFGTAHEQRQHFKAEWHVENVKRKSKNLPPLSE